METKRLVTEYLVREKKTVTFMESCTSGLLASMFTDTEGASSVFRGSLVTYSNEEKIKAGVPEKIINRFGVYSAECARAMAETVKKIYGTDISVSITGTTGNPDPANPGSVLGEAFYCICIGNEAFDFHIQKNVNDMTRAEIKQFYADSVYNSIYQLVFKKS